MKLQVQITEEIPREDQRYPHNKTVFEVEVEVPDVEAAARRLPVIAELLTTPDRIAVAAVRGRNVDEEKTT